MDFLTGWKTTLAALGATALGVSLMCAGLSGESIDWAEVQKGIAALLAGLGMFGIGKKIERKP